MDALVQRLVRNPHDEEAITYAHHAGQTDPRSYAMLLEQVGRTTSDPLFACHWLTESANVWATTLGDAHRAARALMTAIDRDPSQPAPAERLAELYREKGDNKALVALLERRAKALAAGADDPQMAAYVASLHQELAGLWGSPPLSQPKKAVENYRRALELDPTSQYAIYALRELYKGQEQWLDAIPLFAQEQALTEAPDRQIALYQDEAEVRKLAGDYAGATMALRHAWSVDQGQDPAIRQAVAASVLEAVEGGHSVSTEDRQEAAALFDQLAEEYGGEYGVSYSLCALELSPGDDRAVQLAMYYASQLGREAEVQPRAARYLMTNPGGALAGEAQAYLGGADPAQLAATLGEPGSRAARSEAGAAERPARLEIADEVSAVMDDDAPLSDDFGAPAVKEVAAVDPGRAQALVDEAEALARKGRKTEAAAKYREAVALDPAHEEALTFLQTHLRQTRKYAELREVLTVATRTQGASADAKRGWLREIAGLCEAQLRDVDGAIHALQQLIVLDPSEAPRTQLRRLLERGQRWDDVATLLEQEAEQAPDLEARISLEKNLAKLHETKRKDVVAAGDAWARIAALTPEDESALLTAVKFYEKGERLDLAADAIAGNVSALEDPEARSQLLFRLGELRRGAGDPLAAGDAFAEAASLTQRPDYWAQAEESFTAAEAWDQAAQAVDEQAQLASSPRLQAELYAREAELLTRAGDESSALLRLEQATDLDPTTAVYAEGLEAQFVSAERYGDLAAFLLRRAEKLEDRDVRVDLRRRAATLQRDTLGEPDAARETLLELLADGDDEEALTFLANDAEERGEPAEATTYLGRLSRVVAPEHRGEVLLREARLFAEVLEDPEQALTRYREVLEGPDPNSAEALTAIADLEFARGEPAAAAQALERHLTFADDELRLQIAERLADAYEGELDDPKAAARALEIVLKADPEDFATMSRLVALSERLEDWSRVAELLRQLIEVEGDEEELSQMTRRLAEVLHQRCGRGDEALAALTEGADMGDQACRSAYIELGDELGWRGIVATKLVEWYEQAPVGSARNDALRGAFDRFIEVGRDTDAVSVGKELARTRGAAPDLAPKLEELGVKLQDLDAVGVAHGLLVTELSGAVRAEELVRQAEVLKRAGVPVDEAIQHGEQALTSVAAAEVEPLLERLASLAEVPAEVVDLYERQVSRAKGASDRLAALARAAQVAAAHGAGDRARGFFELALGGSIQEETLSELERIAREADEQAGGEQVRRLLASALSSGGQGARDGGRTRAAMLRRAADIVHRELNDVELALGWLKDALIAHVDDEGLDSLEAATIALGEPARAEQVLSAALSEVFDGPLVRKLLARRASVRREHLGEARGAADDLKRLHDLSPSDQGVVDQLSRLYRELEDYRGMVQLYEDQILRGKDPASRAEIARKVARLWEEQLTDPREAADAWRRVLRMKKEDPEATEGLERAKKAMLGGSIAPPPARPASTKPPAPRGVSAAPTTPAAAPSAPELAQATDAEAPAGSGEEAAPASSGELSAADAQPDEVPPDEAQPDEAQPDEAQQASATPVAPGPEHEAVPTAAAPYAFAELSDEVTVVGDASAILHSEDDDDPPTLPPAETEALAIAEAESQLQALRPARPALQFNSDEEATITGELLSEANSSPLGAGMSAYAASGYPSDATEVRPALLAESVSDDFGDDDDDALMVDEDALLVDDDDLTE